MAEVQNDKVYGSNNGNAPVNLLNERINISNQPLRTIVEGNPMVTSPDGTVFEKGETYTISQMAFGVEELQIKVVGITSSGWLELEGKKSINFI